MNTAAIDVLARAAATRRRSLLAVLGGLLAALGPAASDAGGRRRCRPACDECQRCKKGTCRKKHGKKRCKRGTCQPLPDGDPCGGSPCRACRGGACVAQPHGTPCGSNPCMACSLWGVCSAKSSGTPCGDGGHCQADGVCLPAPVCRVAGSFCSILSEPPCCSGNCVFTDPLSGACAASSEGGTCRTDADCALGLDCTADFTCQVVV